MKILVITFLLITSYSGNLFAYEMSTSFALKWCQASANSAGLYLQDRFDGLGLSEIITNERSRLEEIERNNPTPGGSAQEVIDHALKMNMPEILAAFDQRYSDIPSEQAKIKQAFIDKYLSKCLKENLR